MTPKPFMDGDGDGDQTQLHPFVQDACSFPFPMIFNPSGGHHEDHDHYQHKLLQQPKQPADLLMIGEATDEDNTTSRRSVCDPQGSGKWMSSKMRIMRKMLSEGREVVRKPRESGHVVRDQQQQLNPESSSSSNTSSNNNNSPGGVIRVCSDCNTTKTPLWRSGPRGPKSLCNACGIRQRKARRAMAAAAALNGGLVAAPVMPAKAKKEKRSDVDRTVPFKKRCRFSGAGAAPKKIRFDDITINLSNSSAFHGVFPEDERDAAILLMALSCGLISS